MSDTTEQQTRNMKPVLAGMAEGNDKPLTIVRPSKLAKEGITGIVAEGVYMGTKQNPFEEDKLDFRINGSDTDFIINTAGSLASQLGRVEEGTYVEIHYLGKQKAKSGAAQGKMVHNFQVLAEESSAQADS